MQSFEPTVDSFEKVKDLVNFIDQVPAEDAEKLKLLLESMEFGELRLPVDLIGRLTGRISTYTAPLTGPVPPLPGGKEKDRPMSAFSFR